MLILSMGEFYIILELQALCQTERNPPFSGGFVLSDLGYHLRLVDLLGFLRTVFVAGLSWGL